MRTALAVCAALFALAPAVAHAQLNTSCTGAVQMQLGLVVLGSDGQFTSVSSAAVSNLIGQAECLCDSQDLYTEALVTTPLPQGTQESFEVWVGSGCNQLVNRQQGSQACERIMNPTTTLQDYWQGASGRPHERVPVQALISPNSHSCAATSNTNSLWFLFYQQADMPDYCQVTLPANTNLPAAPENVAAGSGDSAITLTWSAPPQTTNRPVNYQVLCADANGNPIASLQSQFPGDQNRGYSTCTPSGMERRTGIFGNSSTTPTDGGTATDDAGLAQANPPSSALGTGGGLHTDATGPDGGTQQFTASDVPAPFTYLDSKFLCSKILTSDVTSTRIDGLENGKSYSFVVIGIDAYGNPAASNVVTASPQPAEDLYRRFRDEGGKPQGFCFVATAAYGSYESPFVQVLRDFRDSVLAESAPGRAFIGWYYAHSPPAAGFIARHGWARFVVRQMLWPLIVVCGLWMWTTPVEKVALLALWLALVAIRRRRARTARRRA